MRFALTRGDARVRMLVATFDRADQSYAETWRAVGEAAETMGFSRPSYFLVRALARAQRLRRRVLAEVRRAALEALLAMRSPLAIDVRRVAETLHKARPPGRFVLQQHKPLPVRPEPP